MSTSSHGISWHILYCISFVTCRHCQVAKQEKNISSSLRPKVRDFWYIALSKSWYTFKVAWHVLVLVTVVHQCATFVDKLTNTKTDFQSVLGSLRWRFKQIASVVVLWMILKGRGKMEEVCLQRQVLEREALKFCSSLEHRRTLLNGLKKFGILFNCISLGLLFIMHSELEIEYSVRFHEIPYQFWPFSISINFWLAEVFFLLTTDILTFLPYFIMIWWCTLVQAGAQYAGTFRQQLKLMQSLQTNVIGKLQNILFTLQSFHAIIEESFSGILFWHIGSAVLTSLSFLGDIVNGTGSDYWLSVVVASQMLIWNTVILVGVPNFFSIKFQEETERLLEDMIAHFKCCPTDGNEHDAHRSRKMDFKLDLMTAQRKPLVFTASRYFSLDRNFVITFIGCVATYAIVVREFVKDDLPALKDHVTSRNNSFS